MALYLLVPGFFYAWRLLPFFCNERSPELNWFAHKADGRALVVEECVGNDTLEVFSVFAFVNVDFDDLPFDIAFVFFLAFP